MRRRGKLQLIDNQVDAAERHGSGSRRVRQRGWQADPGPVRAVAHGPAQARGSLLVNERAIGTDQDKKFVMVVDADNKATYRAVELGAREDCGSSSRA